MNSNMLFQTGNQFHADKKDLRVTKADLKAEIHFIGQILGGIDFATSDGLFCELAIDPGDGWELLQPGANKGIQTQTSYANVPHTSSYLLSPAPCSSGVTPSTCTFPSIIGKAGPKP